ncbi:MAG: DUF3365 domain-containing protein [Cyclobacteriaceae bacterium]|tara:strand:+ start:3423 stop:4088 length:666 start_codon:yes stop_codon:yes gene_type:complete
MKKLFNTPFLALLLALLTIACTSDKKQDTSGVRNEMKDRELVRVSDADLMARGNELGIEIVKVSQGSLQKALLNAIETTGLVGAVEYCNANAYEIVKGLEDSLNVKIKRVSQKPRNPLDAPDSVEQMILEAYAYDFSPTNAVNQILEFDEKTLIFTQPIAIANGLCLNCHGSPGEQVNDEVLAIIQSKYPDDKALGYSLGELRGMWSVKIPKKTVVNALSQ